MQFLKKFFVLLTAAIVLSMASSGALYAQSELSYLKKIAENTTKILERVNAIPEYIEKMLAYTISWLAVDDSDETANMQSSFAALGQGLTKNLQVQNSIQTQLAASLLDKDVNVFTRPEEAPAILKTFPRVNDLMYSSIIGNPPAAKGPFSAMNYIKNAGGLNFNHKIPTGSWRGTPASKERYQNYFNTVISVESFNSYVLSSLYAESRNGNQTTAMQNNLAAQASNSDWIAKIATEELGKVLRQILVFQSQSYVLLTQMVQLQKQLLTASVMTNTLIIANNQVNESMMASKAQGIAPSL